MPGPSTNNEPPPAPERLEAMANETLSRVQDAFIDLVGSVPGSHRPHEIQKTFGLHKTLAWKVAKIVGSSDPLSIYPRLPGPGAVEKVLDSALRWGVARERVDAVRSAMADLDEFVATHAGRRDTFEMMLARFSRQHPAETELNFRKDGFRATSHIWGVQARTIARAVMLWPADDGVLLDAAVIFGAVDLLRLRADRPWVINRWRPTDDEGVPIPVSPEPVEPAESGRAPLLVDFCSKSLPAVRRQVRTDLIVEDEVAAGPIGTSGAVTCFTGEVLRGVMERYRTERSRIAAQNLELRTPCRTVVFDHLVHRDLFGRVSPRLRVFGELAGRPLYSTLRSNVDELEVFESVEHRGTGPGAVRSPDVPGYERIVRRVCERLGWAADELDVYRLRMEFPYVPVTITYDYPLPERPG